MIEDIEEEVHECESESLPEALRKAADFIASLKDVEISEVLVKSPDNGFITDVKTTTWIVGIIYWHTD